MAESQDHELFESAIQSVFLLSLAIFLLAIVPWQKEHVTYEPVSFQASFKVQRYDCVPNVCTERACTLYEQGDLAVGSARFCCGGVTIPELCRLFVGNVTTAVFSATYAKSHYLTQNLTCPLGQLTCSPPPIKVWYRPAEPRYVYLNQFPSGYYAAIIFGMIFMLPPLVWFLLALKVCWNHCQHKNCSYCSRNSRELCHRHSVRWCARHSCGRCRTERLARKERKDRVQLALQRHRFGKRDVVGVGRTPSEPPSAPPVLSVRTVDDDPPPYTPRHTQVRVEMDPPTFMTVAVKVEPPAYQDL